MTMLGATLIPILMGLLETSCLKSTINLEEICYLKIRSLTFPDGTPMWQYKNTWKMFETIMGSGAYDEIEHIQNLIDTCNVWAEHCYLTATYGQLWKQEGTETVIDPKFDSMLSFVKDKKKRVRFGILLKANIMIT